MRRAANAGRRLQHLFEHTQPVEHTAWVAVGVRIHLCDWFGRIGGPALLEGPDEPELTSGRHCFTPARNSPAPIAASNNPHTREAALVLQTRAERALFTFPYMPIEFVFSRPVARYLCRVRPLEHHEQCVPIRVVVEATLHVEPSFELRASTRLVDSVNELGELLIDRPMHLVGAGVTVTDGD